MNTRLNRSLFVVASCLILFSVLYIWNMRVAGQRAVNLPKVTSGAKSIEVVNVKVKGGNTLVVSLRNNSEKPVVAVTLETGDERDGSGVSVTGYKENDEPDSVIIGPHETYDADMPLSYLRADGLVEVSGVVYADGTAEGRKSTLDSMREEKAHIKSGRFRQGGGAQR